MPVAKDHFHDRVYDALHSTGPFKQLNPTTRYIHPTDAAAPTSTAGSAEGSGESQFDDPAKVTRPYQRNPHAVHVWRSRDNRKGRHAVVVDPSYKDDEHHKGPQTTDSLRQTLRGLGKMLTSYPIWDVSYDVATVFTFGSVVWVINGFFSLMPVVAPSSESPGVATWGGGISAFVGATIFEFGSILLMLEAVNENRADCFGWAIEETLDGWLTLDAEDDCHHHHRHKKAWLKATPSVEEASHKAVKGSKKDRAWSWWPSWYELRTHYFRDIGFLACSSQMFGATIFWISGFTALPPILNSLSLPATNGAYWLPQVIGGTGFIVSSTLFMIEVQPAWYIPAPRVLGWHIGLWNLIGALGFTLCGALGFGSASPACLYALTLSTYIGSWAFLIGSAIQWYESLDKYPIWADTNMQKYSGT